MRVVVVGIDGLEYSLVERWDVSEFKQKHYGIHDIRAALKPGDPPYTPLIWASFLLGEPSYRYGYDGEFITRRRVDVAYGRLAWLYRIRAALLGRRSLGLRRVLMKLGIFSVERVAKELSRVEGLPNHLRELTVVAEARRRGYSAWYSEFPTLQENYCARLRAVLSQYFNASLQERFRWLNEIYRFSLDSLKEVVRKAREYDLLLYYTPLIDVAHHMLYRSKSIGLMVRLASIYRRFAQDLRRELFSRLNYSGEEYAFIIVSDHGYDPVSQEHSDYGFWSANVDLPKRPSTVLDFKEIILKLLEL